jgi:hypothetical protein
LDDALFDFLAKRYCFFFALFDLSALDVGITLRVTNITLPPTAQPGAHEDCPTTKVGQYVGSRKGDSPEEGFLMNKERRC